MSDHSTLIRGLTPEQRALLALRLKQQGSRFNAFPASYAQRRLWFLDRLEPGSSYYNIATAVRISGRLSEEALEKSIGEVVRRHETLRTTFAEVEDGLMQVIHAPSDPLLTTADLRSLPHEQRGEEAGRLARASAGTPFDLSAGPLLRTTLIRVGEEEHILVITMHHIVSDGWSLGIFIREVGQCYAAFAGGRQPSLPRMPLQYADFSVWQRNLLQGDALDAELAYWRQQLDEIPPLLELPADHARPAVLSSRGSALSRTLSPDLMKSLHILGRQNNATLFMTLLAGLQTLLYRYTGTTDICVGTPIANRTHPATESMIGFFVNTLVMRTDLSGNPTFTELLQRVRETSLQAYAHQDVPFEMLVEELNPRRDMSHTPLFQVMLVLQNTPVPQRIPSAGLLLTPYPLPREAATTDLSLVMAEGRNGLETAVEYSTDLFTSSRIERLLDHLTNVLTSAASDPQRRIGAMPLLGDKERSQVLVAWNATRSHDLPEKCVHTLFEERAASSPDIIAVTGANGQLSYAELNRKANQLAHFLRSLGAGPEVVAGIGMERSTSMIVAMLGILKAGAAYVPLDPAYPDERIGFMARNATVRIIVTERTAKHRYSGMTGVSVICFDEDAALLNQQPVHNPACLSIPDHPMYLMYTSGSTGSPKGVVVTHRSVVNHNLAVAKDWGLSSEDRVLQFASMNFDAAVEEIFPTFIAGGTLVLRSRDIPSGAEFLRLIERERLTVLDLPTAYWHTWVRDMVESGATLPSSVRLVVLGGEAASYERYQAWRTVTGTVRLLNTYGPTETTIISTWFDAESMPEEGRISQTLPIGGPIANTRLYVLDMNMMPVPCGVQGELYIGGTGLARGYAGRPDLTAERFVPDPFGEEEGRRLYRTGDRVRQMSNGIVEFLGRTDEQVKIRGFRVEIAEVESALRAIRGVRDAAVINVGGSPEGDEQALAAYYVSDDMSIDPDALRTALRSLLPDYMVPSSITEVRELPKTASGKVDRRALLSSVPLREKASSSGTTVMTPTEELLAGIWARLLGAVHVHVQDNFFDLGGHSLLATQMVGRIQNMLHVEIPLRTVFEHPTVASLAAAIDTLSARERGMTIPPIVHTEVEGPAPLTFAQQRLWFLDQLDPGSPMYNIPEVVKLRGALDLSAFSRSLDEIVRRHEILRASFPMVEGKPVQVIGPPAPVPIRNVDLRSYEDAAREREVALLVQEEVRTPFDLAHGPLVRVFLLRLAEEEYVAVLTQHHIISDGWSAAVFVRELSVLYEAFTHGKESPLAELPVQYTDVARWQRAWMKGGVLDEGLRYWKEQLAGMPPLLELPLDRRRGAVQSSRGAHYKFTLDKSLSDTVISLSRKEGVTSFMTLLAAFQTLLYRYSGQKEFCVGTPVANRNHLETEGLIGLFTNTLVLRGDLTGRPSFKELLRRTRDAALGAYTYQDVPFEKIVDAVQPERDLSYSPLFQVMFALQNLPPAHITHPDLEITSLDCETGVAPFDLTLVMEEAAGGYTGAFEYNTDLFEGGTIEQMAARFTVLLRAILHDPDCSVDAVPLMTGEERRQVALGGDGGAAAMPEPAVVHRLVEAQADMTPEATAVEAGNCSLTYRELNARANQLARFLRHNGVGPDRPVGICVDRSAEMAIGLLGILKAGGAYLPLDPSYPLDRLTSMCQDARISFLITQERLAEKCFGLCHDVICLDRDAGQWKDEEQGNLEGPVTPESLAYVMYTSGSTGKPKGVQVSHRAVANHNQNMIRLFGLNPQDRVLQFASISFDGAVEEIFPTWMAGATLVLRNEELPDAGAGFSGLLSEKRVTIADLPTAFWNEWAHELSNGQLPLPSSLRLVIVGGDTATEDAFKTWRTAAGGRVRWLNTYGPTEAAVVCLTYEPFSDKEFRGTGIPIGRPIQNVAAYVLDDQLRLVPPGMKGELCIGGTGLARGYANLPDRTAERFVPDPFSPLPGGRLYRTGDLARFRPDGQIEFLGRVDQQVKIRGFRVEPGEVETVVRKHPSIREAIVDVRGKDAARRLVAYCVPHGAPPTVHDLRQFLGTILPDYMLPSAFVMVDALPRTPGGKIHRRALPDPDLGTSLPGHDHVAPRTVAEQTLVEIWQQVLGVKRVGVQDNFFELGGDSILSIQVVARARQSGLHVSPKQMFEHPTIEGLAGVIQTSSGSADEQGLVTGPVPFTPVQCWFLQEDYIETNHWNQSLLLKVRSHLQPEVLREALRRVVLHHDALRLRIQKNGGSWEQAIAGDEEATFLEVLDFSGLPTAQHRELIESYASAAQRSLNLAHGPLLRAAYMECGHETGARLLLVIHHMAVDAVSWRILLEDLHYAYDQLAAGRAVVLPHKTTSFQSWARGLREYAGSEEILGEAEYWKKMLERAVAPIPADMPGAIPLESSADTHTVQADAGTTEAAVHTCASRYGTRVDEVLLTALGLAYARWSGKRRMLVEIEGHGREDILPQFDVSRTVGWFTSVYPVLIDLGPSVRPVDLLLSVKELLRSIPNHGIGYGILRYLCRDQAIQATMQGFPRTEISFNYLGQLGHLFPEDSPFGPAPESRGAERSGNAHMSHLLDVTAGISNGLLTITWGYSRRVHHSWTIRDLASIFMEELSHLVQCASAQEDSVYTPSDFPMAGLDQAELEKVLARAVHS